MYPLQAFTTLKHGYEFMQPTTYSKHHLGLDLICSIGTQVFAPFDGVATFAPFATGGNVINFTCNVSNQKYVMRFMHLSKIVKIGFLKAGEVMGLSGNTGTITTGPHVHVDISKDNININNLSNFVDPWKFPWVTSGENMALQEKLNTLPEVEFNKFHDIANAQYPGWTAEMYNTNGTNAFQAYKDYLGVNATVLDLLNYLENKPEFIQMRKDLQTCNNSDDKKKLDQIKQIVG